MSARTVDWTGLRLAADATRPEVREAATADVRRAARLLEAGFSSFPAGV